ncbi:MAG: thioredoxin [Lentisphaerae bacterium]|nr:thioredoxin [Lentisphaerota bacterium]
MAGNNIIQISGDNWQKEVMDSAGPVLVDFWAEWCGPCRAMNPILETLAGELTGKLKVAKVNVDENQELAGKFGIRSIPTLLIIKGGTVREQIVGSMNKDTLKAKLSSHL